MKTNDYELSPYHCDNFTTLAFFANSYAATLRVIFDLLSSEYPAIGSAPILEHGQTNALYGDKLSDVFPPFEDESITEFSETPCVWPGRLEKYFHYDPTQRNNVVELKHSNKNGRVACSFLNAVATSILSAFSAEAEFKNSEIAKTPLCLLSSIDESFVTNRELKSALTNIHVALPKRTLRIERTFRSHARMQSSPNLVSLKALDFDQNAQHIKSDNRDIIELALTKFLAHFDAWFSDRFKKNNAYHPALPGLRIYQPAIRRGLVNILCPQTTSTNTSGVYCIIREARGSVTSDREHVNLLLRDLLWIRPFSENVNDGFPIEEHDYRRIRTDDDNQKFLNEHGGRIGFYYSAIDGLIYEVKRIVHRQDMLLIDGVALRGKEKPRDRDSQPDKSMCMYLPNFDNDNLDFTMGTLMGGTKKNLRTGGWTVVGVRPALPDAHVESLQKKFCVFADSFELMTRDRYDQQISVLAQFIEKTGLVGILHSRNLLKLERDRKLDAGSIGAMEAFRKLFRTIDSYQTHCDELLEEIQSSVFDGKKFNQSAFRSHLLSLIEQQNTYAIAPVTVFKSEISNFKPDEISASVQMLASRDIGFRSYAEYDKLVKETTKT